MSTRMRSQPYPTGDLALLLATIAVGLWPFAALALGSAPPSWELGVGTVLVLLALRATARSAFPSRRRDR